MKPLIEEESCNFDLFEVWCASRIKTLQEIRPKKCSIGPAIKPTFFDGFHSGAYEKLYGGYWLLEFQLKKPSILAVPVRNGGGHY